eukprot:gb/GEZJ01000649.1/.p1 GENE.gb/GEZJ01000649.1/~~gb/GEZJ01000649.1/.p1  ORF type:complete len:305 (-),score=37.72 gb/GEZJ01000649.1/:464-1378(-)
MQLNSTSSPSSLAKCMLNTDGSFITTIFRNRLQISKESNLKNSFTANATAPQHILLERYGLLVILVRGQGSLHIAIDANMVPSPLSDENRIVTFNRDVAYFDSEMQVMAQRLAEICRAFSAAHHSTIAISSAFDELLLQLSRCLKLSFDSRTQFGLYVQVADAQGDSKQLVGARMLKERILRKGKMLAVGILKVSSFLSHMVDTDLMEVCGEELAESLRPNMTKKIVTVQSTVVIVELPTAKTLGIPLVFASKSQSITISDSYETTYRSATKGTSNELIVFCDYREGGDRVLIIDDFLAWGSTA